MKPILYHVPLVAMLLILGVFALIDAGRLEGLRSETTFAWMLVVGYPLIALLGLTQVALWIRWISKGGMPSWFRSRRIMSGGLLILLAMASALVALRIYARWGLGE